MKSTLYNLLLIVSLLLPGLAMGQSDTQRFDDFDGVTASGNIELVLIPDDENYAEIEVKKISIDKLEIDMKGSTLKFKLKNRGLLNLFGGNGKAIIELHYTENLERIGASASADISSSDVLRTGDLRLKSTSGSTITLKLECDDIDVSASSGADIVLNGEFNNQKVSVSSGASYESDDVESRKAEAKVSSGGNIKIWATDVLIGKASSGGNINYRGYPTKTDLSSSSGGSVESIN